MVEPSSAQQEPQESQQDNFMPEESTVVQPQPSSSSSSYDSQKQRKVFARGVKALLRTITGDEDYLRETEGFRRLRRDTEAAFDPKCNSEALKEIILKNIADSTALSKRKIQETATDELGGRIDVICSSGTFSYIVNTELYCET
ncbi:unnamed protein product, partial [Cylicostephanus goldi]